LIYQAPDKSRRSAMVSNILKTIFAVSLVLWLIKTGSIRLEYLTVSPDDLHILFCGTALLLLGLSISAVRYTLLLSGVGVLLAPSKSLKITAVMYFFTQCVLGPASGDVARFFYTMHEVKEGNKIGAAITVDRFIGTMGLFALAGVGIVFNWNIVTASPTLTIIAVPFLTMLCGLWLGFILGFIALIKSRKVALLAGMLFPIFFALISMGVFSDIVTEKLAPALFLASLAALCAPIIAPELLHGGLIHKKFFSRSKIGCKIADFLSALLLYRNRPAIIAKTIAFTAVQHMTFITVIYLFAQCQKIPVHPDFAEIFFSTPLAFLAGIIPAPAAGLGVNETAFETLLSLVSNNAVSAGASIYLMYRLWTTIFSLSGVTFLIKNKKVDSA